MTEERLRECERIAESGCQLEEFGELVAEVRRCWAEIEQARFSNETVWSLVSAQRAEIEALKARNAKLEEAYINR